MKRGWLDSSCGWPISRVGNTFKVICARPAVAQIRATVTEIRVLDGMRSPVGRDAEDAPLQDIKRSVRQCCLMVPLHGTGRVPDPRYGPHFTGSAANRLIN